MLHKYMYIVLVSNPTGAFFTALTWILQLGMGCLSAWGLDLSSQYLDISHVQTSEVKIKYIFLKPKLCSGKEFIH